jgi:hypothetical protein
MSDYIGNRPAPVPLTADQVQGAVAQLPTLSLRNRIQNGCFRVFQRGSVGASVTANTSVYNADRWMAFSSAASTQGRFASTAYGGIWAMNFSMPTAAAGSFISGVHRIESVDIADLVGKTVTLSFWAAAAVTTGGFSGIIYIGHPTNTADTYTAITYPIGPTTFALDGTASRKSITFTVPAGCDKGMEINIRCLKDGTAGTTLAMSIGSVQLEEGSTATPFERRPYQMELAFCQRHYQAFTFRSFVGGSTTYMGGSTLLPVALRTATPAIAYSDNGGVANRYSYWNGAALTQGTFAGGNFAASSAHFWSDAIAGAALSSWWFANITLSADL